MRILLALALIGCTHDVVDDRGSVQRLVDSAAAEAAVPAELLLAIAVEEGGTLLPQYRSIDLDDHVPVAGLLELRHGRLNTLALGAKLVGSTEEILQGDTDLATHAGAKVLAELGAQYGASGSFESWRRALEVLSGMDDANAEAYASRVLNRVRGGGVFPARSGETLTLTAHPEVAAQLEAIALTPPPAGSFPGAIQFPTSCTDKCTVGRPLGTASVNKIVIHDTEGGWNASVATLQYDPGKSVHYIIDADGSRVGQFRPETDTTWHAGNYFYNETSVGIEHVGVAANPAGYSSALYETSRSLVKDIRTRWSVPLDRKHIVGHYQIPNGNKISEQSGPCASQLDTCENSPNFGGAGRHTDPGLNWQWCQYMEALGGSCTCEDAWDHFNCTTDKTEAVRCTNGVVEIQHCTSPCEVMPIGQDDVCTVDAGPGSGSDPGSGDDGGGSGETPEDPAGNGGGCSTSGHSLGIAFAVALLAMMRRRHPPT